MPPPLLIFKMNIFCWVVLLGFLLLLWLVLLFFPLVLVVLLSFPSFGKWCFPSLSCWVVLVSFPSFAFPISVGLLFPPPPLLGGAAWLFWLVLLFYLLPLGDVGFAVLCVQVCCVLCMLLNDRAGLAFGEPQKLINELIVHDIFGGQKTDPDSAHGEHFWNRLRTVRNRLEPPRTRPEPRTALKFI